ncbi:uncharacterized protein LOC124442375 [Xenia sp. Carnegie-2017]|uniref:uncharacterized protein LOC124442375 n=1 Tax=Xenia sp. Carnegie-2017 TaxID=2897299 RepID=UPI001F0452AD|nr:uncharacterized protein LOC124442375 [Xenia sp. Carnegie-2017]
MAFYDEAPKFIFIILASTVIMANADANATGNTSFNCSTAGRRVKVHVQLINLGTRKLIRIKNKKLVPVSLGNDRHTFFIMTRYGKNVVSLQSYHTQEYVCFDKKGVLEVKTVSNFEKSFGCHFYKNLINTTRFFSCLNQQWKIAFHKKLGTSIKGNKSSKTLTESTFFVVFRTPPSKRKAG